MPDLRDGLATRLRAAGVPGGAVAVVARDGATETHCFGDASLAPARPVEPRTVFRLFSGTKVYTAAALMVLVERGVVALDDSVGRYLPDLRLRHPVSIRQLASHASGLPDTLRAFLAVHFSGERPPSTAEALARYAVDAGARPGRRAAYRNVNYAILGELVSRTAGCAYDAFVRDAVLAPLGADLRFEYDVATLARAATGYLPRFSPVRLALRLLVPGVASRLYAGAAGRLVALRPYALDTAAIGGLLGDASAFAPLLREMLDPGDGVLTRASKREMLTMHAAGAAGVVSRVGVGLGWKLGRVGATEFWNHEGGGAGFCSETRLYPSARLGVVVLMNRSQSSRLSRLAHEMCEDVRRAFA
jgi:D-alanyl-D-alanine carboxypeptidase